MSETLVRDPEAAVARLRKTLPDEPADCAGELGELHDTLRRQQQVEAALQQEMTDLEQRRASLLKIDQEATINSDFVQVAAARVGADVIHRRLEELRLQLTEARVLTGHARRRADSAAARYHEARNAAFARVSNSEPIPSECRAVLTHLAGVGSEL